MPRKSSLPKFDFKAAFNPDDYLHFYVHTIGEEMTKLQIDFLADHLRLDEPMKILDLACGHGRHANGLAKIGHEVTGVDLTAGFLSFARKRAAALKVKVKYVRADMRQIAYKNEFDRVILMFTAFGYFSDNDNLRVLKNVARALKTGGLFCFDSHNRDMFMKGFLPYHSCGKGSRPVD